MNITFLRDLVVNLSILFTASTLYMYTFTAYRNKRFIMNTLIGFISATVGVLLLIVSVELVPGVFFDTRTILISTTGLFFGAVPAVIAVFVISAARLIIAGAGAWTGVLTTFVTAGFGLLWRRYRWKKIDDSRKPLWLELYLFGLATHVLMLACMFSLPINTAMDVLRRVTLPVLILYPIGVVLVGMMIWTRLNQIKVESALRESEIRMKALYGKAPVGIAVTNDKGILFTNKMFETIIGKPKEGLTEIDWYDLTQPDDPAADQRNLQAFLQGLTDAYELDKHIIKPDGTDIWVHIVIAAVKPDHSDMRSHLYLLQDITQRKRREEEILYASVYDVMTGLYNRNYMDHEIMRMKAENRLPVSFIMCDVDGLMLINDAFGREEGDALLKEVSSILKGCCRERDIIARVGGDEFLILLPETDNSKVYEVYQCIKNKCDERNTHPHGGIHYTSVSLGYATKTQEDELLSNVIKTAAGHMYTRKLLAQKSLHSAVLTSIKATLFEKSNETEEHVERMAVHAVALGKEMGLRGAELDELELGALLHDIGKIRVDLSILKKPGKLDEKEWEEIRKHPETGYRIAQSVSEMQNVSEIILCHHERWDGTGYPQQLKEEEIPLLARIISVVDAYDAMTDERGYQRVLSSQEAVAEILHCAGSQFDPRVASTFVEKILNQTS
jgi:diguanylate cyclase (GGDEF)-like protein/PAS domain S-box-containing protein/putative nucleotidyltransferase with HDIG domain